MPRLLQALRISLRLDGDDTNFIKIDVEGAEILALNGAQKLLSEVRPTIYIEVADDNLDEATQLLASYNYDLFDPLTDPTGRPHPIDRCMFNTLAIPR